MSFSKIPSDRQYETNYVRFEDSLNMSSNIGNQPQLQTGNLFDTPTTEEPLIHHISSNNVRTWNHIKDLDTFFKRIYQYHQRGGFLSIVVREFLNLFVFFFIVALFFLVWVGINYPALSETKTTKEEGSNDTFITAKKSIRDCLHSREHIYEDFTAGKQLVLICSVLFWIYSLLMTFRKTLHYWDIKKFFNIALGVEDSKLVNVTWDEIQLKVLEVQNIHQMCINNLNELAIYHRILRFENYFIAMVNRGIIDFRINIPFIGQKVFLTRGLRQALDFLLFNGLYPIFENSWHIKEEYRDQSQRIQLAESLKCKIISYGLVLLIFSPFLFLCHLMCFILNYTDTIKKEPGFLGVRRWSNYAHVYFRHYNELEHELKARLKRAYRPANTYINSFTSQVLISIAEPLTFIFGSSACIIFFLTFYDLNVLDVEYVMLIFTLSGGLTAAGRSLTPDENLAWFPETLMKRILSEVHYLPDHWITKAHCTYVRDEFTSLFQYKASHYIEAVISPIVTPLYFIFYLSKRSLHIVDFFRHFTVDVEGVGHVCSFAMMNIKKHGNSTWQPNESDLYGGDIEGLEKQDTDNGRTERSLVHFALTNPRWKPPNESNNFLNAIKKKAEEAGTSTGLGMLPEEQLNLSATYSLTGVTNRGSNINPRNNYVVPSEDQSSSITQASERTNIHPSRYIGQISEGAIARPSGFASSSIMGASSVRSGALSPPLSPRLHNVSADSDFPTPEDVAASNMRLSMWFMNDLHKENVDKTRYHDAQSVELNTAEVYQAEQASRGEAQTQGHRNEKTPLL